MDNGFQGNYMWDMQLRVWDVEERSIKILTYPQRIHRSQMGEKEVDRKT